MATGRFPQQLPAQGAHVPADSLHHASASMTAHTCPCIHHEVTGLLRPEVPPRCVVVGNHACELGHLGLLPRPSSAAPWSSASALSNTLLRRTAPFPFVVTASYSTCGLSCGAQCLTRLQPHGIIRLCPQPRRSTTASRSQEGLRRRQQSYGARPDLGLVFFPGAGSRPESAPPYGICCMVSGPVHSA